MDLDQIRVWIAKQQKIDSQIKQKGAAWKSASKKNVVEFIPDSVQETDQLEKLWNTIVDCVKFNQKLVPIGEYVPQKSNIARFTIENV